MKLITAAILVSFAVLPDDAIANRLAGVGPKTARDILKRISLSPRSKFSAEGHSGSLDLCESHSSHDTGIDDDDECLESTCEMYAEHGNDLEAAEMLLDTCEFTLEETMSSATLSVDFEACQNTPDYEKACTDAATGKVLTADMDITCMEVDRADSQAHPNLKMGHTSDDNDYRLIFDLEGVPGCFGDACNTADPTEADVAEFEKIVAHEIMEELEEMYSELRKEEVAIHCEGARGEIHTSHDHASHDHASHDHASHDHANNEHLRGIVKLS